MISLGAQLRRVRRRLLGIGAAAAAVWGLAAVTILLLLGAWLDLLWEFPPQWRIATFWVAASGIMLLGVLSAATLCLARCGRRPAARSGGPVGRQNPHRLGIGPGTVEPPRRTDAAGVDAKPGQYRGGRRRRCRRGIPLGQVAPVRPLGRSLGAIAFAGGRRGGASGLPAGAGRDAVESVRAAVRRRAPFSPIEFKVTPGNTRVVYGSELEIRVTVIGPPVEQLELVLEAGNRQEPPLPMFPEADGQWRAVLARVVEPTDYYVRALPGPQQAVSPWHHHGATDRQLARLRIEPPAYANQAAYEGPLPKEGVATGCPAPRCRLSCTAIARSAAGASR